MARNLALISLSLTLGVLFVLLGTMLLTPAISPDVHKEVVMNYLFNININKERVYIIGFDNNN